MAIKVKRLAYCGVLTLAILWGEQVSAFNISGLDSSMGYFEGESRTSKPRGTVLILLSESHEEASEFVKARKIAKQDLNKLIGINLVQWDIFRSLVALRPRLIVSEGYRGALHGTKMSPLQYELAMSELLEKYTTKKVKASAVQKILVSEINGRYKRFHALPYFAKQNDGKVIAIGSDPPWLSGLNAQKEECRKLWSQLEPALLNQMERNAEATQGFERKRKKLFEEIVQRVLDRYQRCWKKYQRQSYAGRSIYAVDELIKQMRKGKQAKAILVVSDLRAEAAKERLRKFGYRYLVFRPRALVKISDANIERDLHERVVGRIRLVKDVFAVP